MRRTKALVKVASELLEDPDGDHYGYGLSRASGVRSGAMYPILTRLLDAGWVSDGWQDTRTLGKGQRPRRFYRLTTEGREMLQALVDIAPRG